MTDELDPRGILFPSGLPEFHRVPAPAELADLARWFWIPEWRLAPGETSRQEVLPFPACNLTVQAGSGGPAGGGDAGATVGLTGPTTRISQRELSGSGWAVGALLRPGGVSALRLSPAELRDLEVPFDAPGLAGAVSDAMVEAGPPDVPGVPDAPGVPEVAGRRERAAGAYGRWLAEHAAPPDPAALTANELEELIRTDREVVHVDRLARLLGLSTRSVQRLSLRFIGLPPLAVIRRYRLQEAALRLREHRDVTIAEIAAELGYSDQAHLGADFRTVLGFAPGAYRRGSR
ncbi:helix-turn-helix domain-containing protein [Pseudactinotalea sp. HY158]|uniref:helix-turn-helix domain-containing protein n=1 Tax=Pseudactinotalea sp. HY158 TaxID=2654547 RepID=UPI00129CC8C7|nr:helix-turn-helix domain-containing protein [Pseudactinotalea sp. HY158]QGH69797.1 helix-turn-helix domain-containing protein [Pseudactinotalea sp. HY158]